jgi:DNA-binding HxlR family transcriptional regulator
MAVKHTHSRHKLPEITSVARKPSALRPALVNGSGADSLDNLIHERTRLAIISTLAVHDRMSFSELKAALQMSDGNLSVQARKLEDAGYLLCEKRFAGRTPRTEYSLTPVGREALQRYVAHMEAIIKTVKNDA